MDFISPKTTEQLAELLTAQFNLPEKGSVENLRYVMYVRKSTDEKDKQERSLADQAKDCEDMQYRLGLNVVKVIVEKSSAKEPDIRPKFRAMLEGINNGMYDAILTWHPDRLARNMKEGGEIIDLIDKNIIKDLKFPSFTFNNDTSGIMNLGIMFVLSKQYSDHLSDAVMRGNRRSIEDGAYINKAKHGYKKDNNQFLRPDGRNFTLIQKAFRMRLNGKTLNEIADYLKKEKYTRTNTQGGKTYGTKINKQAVQKILRDPVYAGVVVYGKQVANLVAIYGFEPAVSVEDFMTINKLDKKSDVFKLAKKYYAKAVTKAHLLNGKVLCSECGEAKSAGITTKKKSDGSKTNYFYYRCETIGCSLEQKSTRANVILDFAKQYLATLPFSTKEAHGHYQAEMKRIVVLRTREVRNQLIGLQNQLGDLEDRTEALKANIAVEVDLDVRELQQKDLQSTKKTVNATKQNIHDLKEKLENLKTTPLAMENFLELMAKLPKILAETKKMADLDYLLSKIFLNFTVSQKNVVAYTLNAPFGALDSGVDTNVSNGGGYRTRTCDLFSVNELL
jgi:DNA invertase Pin-like site-specific DNA recombinase